MAISETYGVPVNPSKEGRLYEAGSTVKLLKQALRHGSADLASVPGMLVLVIRQRMWEERSDPNSGRIYRHESFAEFVTSPQGLNTDAITLEKVCWDYPEARQLLTEALKRSGGRPLKTVDNVHSSRPAGNTEAAALRRLRKDRPDLLKRVIGGEMSAYRAMIEAGFRKPTASIPIGTPEAAMRALLRRFSEAELRSALDGLSLS
jgi:hypothetical protein